MESELVKYILSRSSHKLKNVRSVKEIERKSACGNNANFVGEVLRVKCILEYDSGETETTSIIVKKEPSEKQFFTEMYKNFKIFNAETNVYEKLLFQMEELLNKCNEPAWKLWPDYYGHNGKDIFLQDLKVEGYQPYPKAKALNLEEAVLVFKSLGLFHGLSISLVQKGIYDPSNMPPNVFVRGDPTINETGVQACKSLADVIEAEWGSEWQIYPDKIRKLGDEHAKISLDLWNATRGTFDVINHGDCWINNMLFKYDSSGRLKDMRFVDYQACHYNSYSWDMIQVFFRAILPSLREDNLDLFLSTYLDSLRRSSEKTGYEGDLPSIETMKAELDRLAPLSLASSFICYPVFLNPDMAMPDNNEAEGEDEFDYKPFLKSKFVKDIIKRTLIYFHDRNLF